MYVGYEEYQMLKPGDKNLSRKKYAEAIEAYKAVLAQNPHDFLALRGLMLAAAKIRDPDELSYIHSEGEEDFTYDFDLAISVIEGASEEDKKYFADFEKIYSDMKRISDSKVEIESLGNDKTTNEAYIKHNEKLRRRQYVNHKMKSQHPKKEFISNWILCAMVLLCMIFMLIYFKPDASMAVMLVVSFILIICGLAAFNIFYVYPRINKVKEFDRTIAELHLESAEIDEKIKTCKAEAEKLSGVVDNSIEDFIKRDKQILSDMRREYLLNL